MNQVINENGEILEVYEALDNIAPVDKKELIVPFKGFTKEEIFLPKEGQAKAKDIFLPIIRGQIENFDYDISTPKGREAIHKFSKSIGKIRLRIEDTKKEVTAEWKKKASEVDGEARQIKAELEKLEELARKPLTDFEEAEKQRVAEHEGKIGDIESFGRATVSNIESGELFLNDLEISINRDWQEFKERATRAYQISKQYLNEQIERLKEIARQEAELAELQRKADEARQKERDEAIRREAEEKARREAEAKAEAERQAILKAEQEKREEELRKQREEQARIDAERLAKEREEQAKIEAERKKAQAEKEALEKKLAEQKAEAERLAREAEEKERKQREEADRIEKERLAREADLEHRKTINNQAVADLVLHGITKEQAIAIVTAIAKGQVSNVSINY